MTDLKKSIVNSLDGRDVNLFPHLPYLLQDLWEIGASPPHFIQLIRKNRLESKINRALDLGCGKGAVAVQLAKVFGWQIYGIDAMPAFIEDSKQWSKKYSTEVLCTFEVGDIREQIQNRRDYDLVLLGSIGPVLGSIKETLVALKPCLKQTGYVLLDDGYLKGKNSKSPHDYPTREKVFQQIRESGFHILDELIYSREFMIESNQKIFAAIQNRAMELAEKYPEKKRLFEAYVRLQEEENETLENEIVCVTWLLQNSV